MVKGKACKVQAQKKNYWNSLDECNPHKDPIWSTWHTILCEATAAFLWVNTALRDMHVLAKF